MDQLTAPTDDLSTLMDKLDKDGMATLLALLQEKTATDAAKVLSLSRSGLYVRIEKYGLDKIIAQIPRQAIIRLQLHSVKAADTIGELMESKDEKVRLEAAKETLDRVGIMGSPEVIVQSNTQVNIPNEFIDYDSISSGTESGSKGQDQV